MAIESGQIVKNLIPTESVVINKIQPLGSMVSITFTGINSSRQNSKVITQAEYENLEVLTQEGNFNFNGDPEKFKLFAEAERINSAYQSTVLLLTLYRTRWRLYTNTYYHYQRLDSY
jgi:hypothetical protein